MDSTQQQTTYVSPTVSFLTNPGLVTLVEAFSSPTNKPKVQTPNANVRRYDITSKKEGTIAMGDTFTINIDGTTTGFVSEISLKFGIQVAGGLISCPFIGHAMIKTINIKIAGVDLIPVTNYKDWLNILLWGMDVNDAYRVLLKAHEWNSAPTASNNHMLEVTIPWFGSRLWFGKAHPLFNPACLGGSQKMQIILQFEGANFTSPYPSGDAPLLTPNTATWSLSTGGQPVITMTMLNFIKALNVNYGTTVRIPIAASTQVKHKTIAGGVLTSEEWASPGVAVVAITALALSNLNKSYQYYFNMSLTNSMTFSPQNDSNQTKLLSIDDCLDFMLCENPSWSVWNPKTTGQWSFGGQIGEVVPSYLNPFTPELVDSALPLTTVVVPTYLPTPAFRLGVSFDDPNDRSCTGIYFFAGTSNYTVSYSWPAQTYSLQQNPIVTGGPTGPVGPVAATYDVSIIATQLAYMSIEAGLFTLKKN